MSEIALLLGSSVLLSRLDAAGDTKRKQGNVKSSLPSARFDAEQFQRSYRSLPSTGAFSSEQMCLNGSVTGNFIQSNR